MKNVITYQKLRDIQSNQHIQTYLMNLVYSAFGSVAWRWRSGHGAAAHADSPRLPAFLEQSKIQDNYLANISFAFCQRVAPFMLIKLENGRRELLKMRKHICEKM